MQHSLIQEFVFYEFELDHNTAEAIKNICCVKGEGAVDHSITTRWLKKFNSSYKNLDDQASAGRPKTVYSEAILPAIEANPVSNTQRVSSKLNIS